MDIQPTPLPQPVLDTQEDGLPRVLDPRTNTTDILVPAVDTEAAESFRTTTAVHGPSTRWSYAARQDAQTRLAGPPR